MSLVLQTTDDFSVTIEWHIRPKRPKIYQFCSCFIRLVNTKSEIVLDRYKPFFEAKQNLDYRDQRFPVAGSGFRGVSGEPKGARVTEGCFF